MRSRRPHQSSSYPPVSDDEFVRKDVEISYTFVRSPGGSVDKIKLKFTEGSSEAPRISKDAMVPYDKKSLELDPHNQNAASILKKLQQ